MLVGQPYRQDLVAESFDVIVIGSGIGGLCVAALLSKAGKKVLVLERHYVVGGFTHTFKRQGYEWDVGVHYIGEVHKKRSILRRIFDDITEGALAWSHMPEVYDKIFFPDDTYEFVSGIKRLKAQLADYFPHEKPAIEQYFRLVNEARNAAGAFFTERALPPWMGRVAHPFLSSKFLKYANRTTRDVITELSRNRKLLGVLTAQYGDYGLPPGQSSFAMHALLARHYSDGGNYPIGGAASIARAIAPVIEKSGGKILIRAEVKEIMIRRKRALGVRLSNGDEIRANIVVSNAGLLNTFSKLISPELTGRLALDQKLRQVSPSTCHICLYVGLQESAQKLGLEQTNYWIYPDYDHDENIKNYLADPSSALPVTYISFPSAKDPDWERRYPGKSTIEVLSFAPFDWFATWAGTEWKKRGEEYEAYKAQLSQRLLDQLYRYVPPVMGKVDYYELSTPLSTMHFSNYDHGAIYGLAHTPQRFGLHWLRPHTPIQNLFLTGQDIVTVGVAGALFSGVLTASAILRRNVIKDIYARTSFDLQELNPLLADVTQP